MTPVTCVSCNACFRMLQILSLNFLSASLHYHTFMISKLPCNREPCVDTAWNVIAELLLFSFFFLKQEAKLLTSSESSGIG